MEGRGPAARDGFVIKYSSLGRLSEDHQSYLTHGGMMLPWEGKPPEMNAQVLLRVVVPSGAYFDFPSRVVRVMDNRGFMVMFEVGARTSQIALDELVVNPAFQALIKAQQKDGGVGRTILRMEPPKASVPAASPASAPSFIAEGADLPDEAPQDASETTQPDGPIFPTPGPGESFAVFVVKYTSLTEFMMQLDVLTKDALFTVPIANDPAAPGDLGQLRLTLPGHNVYEMFAVIEEVAPDKVKLRLNAIDPVYQSACAFARTNAGQKRLASEAPGDRAPPDVLRMSDERTREDGEDLPLRRRIQRMSMEEKMNLALSGNREERMALAQDNNRAIHHYLLKNARISLDEIAFMARLPTLNPDVLSKIGENPAFTQNPQIVKNLVYNPKTPAQLAVRLLDRVSKSELNVIARRTSMNRQIVMAAQKKLGR